ncbi:hypothetical protein FNYG_13759 [Fusarium nygamai]|uniref:Uncharacterized protein n=1 Tax=Gibberella nygamai TaxID=42673 RepID=A0A2K0UUL4_GIBNY|nr:hypothetical protein FNYG_13759 [Fusarium nygamai]
MHCSKTLYLLAACYLYISIAAGLSRSRSQFKTFFPTVEQYSSPLFHANCSDQFKDYWNESKEDPGRGHEYSKNLLDCILEEYGEVNKANMAVTGILLALLPAGLVQLGPGLAEISLLSTRRPILATLLGFGLLSPSPTEFDFENIVNRAFNAGEALIPTTALNGDGTPFLAKLLVSFVEYGIAMAAAANYFYHLYRFTYHAIPLAPLVVYIPGVPETATLFGWGLLNLPIFLLAFVVSAKTMGRATSRSEQDNKRNPLARFIIAELTPCGQCPKLKHSRTPGHSRTRPRLLGPAVRLVSGLHIITGTVLIGSIVLIPLGDSLPVIYAFIFAAICTRAILSYELNGLALRANPESEKQTQSTDRNDTRCETGGHKSQEYTRISQVDPSVKTASGRLG